MIFNSHELNKSSVISVEISDSEYYNLADKTSLLRRFEVSILNRIAIMVAGYYFKKNKDKIIELINIEDVNKVINEEIKNRIIKNIIGGESR